MPRISPEKWSMSMYIFMCGFADSAADVLGQLVRLSEHDRPSGIQAQVLRTVQNMVVLLDEQFLVHSAVHRAVLRLLRTCVGDDLQEQLDGRKRRVMGAAGTAVRAPPSEYEEDCKHVRPCRLITALMKRCSSQSSLYSLQQDQDTSRVAHDLLPR
jgi:hypothetical protein